MGLVPLRRSCGGEATILIGRFETLYIAHTVNRNKKKFGSIQSQTDVQILIEWTGREIGGSYLDLSGGDLRGSEFKSYEKGLTGVQHRNEWFLVKTKEKKDEKRWENSPENGEFYVV